MRSVLIGLALFSLGVSLAEVRAENVLAEDVDGVRVTDVMLRHEIALMPPEEQARVTHDPRLAEETVRRLFNREKLLRTAEQAKVEEDPLVQYRLYSARAKELIKVMKDRVEAQAAPDMEPRAREYFRVHPEEFVGPEKVRASHILLKAGNEAERAKRRGEMDKIVTELKAGADFAALAEKYSEDSSASRGGDLGWFARGKMVKPFEEAVFSMTTPGETRVVDTKFGIHLIRFDGREDGKVPEFEAVKGKLMEKLAKEYKDKVGADWVKENTKPIQLKVYPELLKEFSPNAAAGTPPPVQPTAAPAELGGQEVKGPAAMQ